MVIQAGLKEVYAIKEIVCKSENKAVSLSFIVYNAEEFFPIPLFSATEEDWDNLLALNLKDPLLFITSLRTKNEIFRSRKNHQYRGCFS